MKNFNRIVIDLIQSTCTLQKAQNESFFHWKLNYGRGTKGEQLLKNIEDNENRHTRGKENREVKSDSNLMAEDQSNWKSPRSRKLSLSSMADKGLPSVTQNYLCLIMFIP